MSNQTPPQTPPQPSSQPSSQPPPQPSGAPTPAATETDPAVEFLAALLPREPAVRKRAFSALLRAVVAGERSVR